MNKLNKRGQFFLFAAIIISSIVLSFGPIANKVTSNPEPENLKELSSQVKRELNYVGDHDLKNDPDKFDNFILTLSEQIRKEDSGVNFIFIYGDNSKIKIKYYGSNLVKACMNNFDLCEGVEPTPIFSGYAFTGTNEPIVWVENSVNALWEWEFNGGNIESITLTVNERDFSFPVGKIKQSIFLIQKEVDNEIFIEAR